MRTAISIKSLTVAALLALALLVAGFAASQAGGQRGPGGSVQGLTEAANRGVDLDFTPLASPTDAVRRSHLIVSGTLVKVGAGLSVKYGDAARTKREANSYATFVIAVDRVLSGDAARVTSGHVYVAVFKSTSASAKKLSALNPRAKVVAVLEDLTGWRPTPGATVLRPSGVPAQAHLYAPFNDGLWLQGSNDSQMFGIGADRSELKQGWSGVRTVDQFGAAAAKAAGRR